MITKVAATNEALDGRQQASQQTVLFEQMMLAREPRQLQSRDEAVIDFRSRTTPAVVLGLRAVIVASRPAPSSTSPEHGYDIRR